MRCAERVRESVLAVTLLVVTCAACRPEADAGRVLLHRLTLPQKPDGVFLNEELLFYFSGELDRTSVTSESVRIRAQDGHEARGTWFVEGDHLRFVPAPVLAASLDDGGYRPDTHYEVEIRGFPYPDGLRGVHGEPLIRTQRFGFHTVSVAEPRASLVFVDSQPDRVRQLRFFPLVQAHSPGRYEIRPQDSIYLKSEKPIDPSTVHDASFFLVSPGRAQRRIPLVARLLENEPESRPRPRNPRASEFASDQETERESRAALLELTPLVRLAPTPSGAYYTLAHDPAPRSWRLRGASRATRSRLLGSVPRLEFTPVVRHGPLDFGGHPLFDPSLSSRPIHVVGSAIDPRRGAYTEEFDRPDLGSPLAWPKADGTATWSDTGRVEVRFPAAAGTGLAGDVRLEGAIEARDVHAVRLEVRAGETARLSSAPGLVVLRAQGRLGIAGRLERRSGEGAPMTFAGGALTSWIESAAGRNWTVLVAGGDLVVDGAIDVSTPLFVCAGGMVRVSGSVVAAHGQIHRLGVGGGGSVPFESAALEIDPPTTNPLREELTFAVLSAPLPQRGQSATWKAADAPRGSDPWSGRWSGSWRVRYLPDVGGGPEGLVSAVPVDDPRLLGSAGHIRFLVELSVRPGPRWSPPFVDSVSLEWDEESPRSPRSPASGARRGER